MEQNHPEPRVNLHTHTFRCRHAAGTPADYCEAARKYNFDILGFSDHAPFPDERYHGSRMFFRELEGYCRDVASARKQFPDLRVLTGLEVEYCPDLGENYYSEELLGKAGLDYLIGAAHFVTMPDGSIHPFYSQQPESPEVIRAFLRQTLRTLEHLPIVMLAHPDGFASTVPRMTPDLKAGFRDIIAVAVNRGIPLEINANGMRRGTFSVDGIERYRYPWEPFWELAAEAGATVVIGSDAHQPEHLILQYKECEDLARRFGLPIVNRVVAETILAGEKPSDYGSALSELPEKEKVH